MVYLNPLISSEGIGSPYQGFISFEYMEPRLFFYNVNRPPVSANKCEICIEMVEVISSSTIFYNKREGKPCKQTRFNSMLMVSLPSKMKRKESLLIIQFIKLKTSKPREFSPLQHTRNKLAVVQQTSNTSAQVQHNKNKLAQVHVTTFQQQADRSTTHISVSSNKM